MESGVDNVLKGKILVVDDDDGLRNLMALIFRMAGYHVTDTPDPFMAQSLAFQGETFDLLVTDFQMPEMNGVELAEWYGANQPETKVLIVTGAVAALKEFLEGGVSDFPCLQKPFSPTVLLARVKELLAARLCVA